MRPKSWNFVSNHEATQHQKYSSSRNLSAKKFHSPLLFAKIRIKFHEIGFSEIDFFAIELGARPADQMAGKNNSGMRLKKNSKQEHF